MTRYVITLTREAAERIMALIPETAFKTLEDAYAWRTAYAATGYDYRVWGMCLDDGRWKAFDAAQEAPSGFLSAGPAREHEWVL